MAAPMNGNSTAETAPARMDASAAAETTVARMDASAALHQGDLSRGELTVAHSSASYLSRQNHMTAAGQIFTTLSCTDDVAKDAWSKYKTRDRSSSSLCGPRHQLKCLLKCAGSLTSTKRERRLIALLQMVKLRPRILR